MSFDFCHRNFHTSVSTSTSSSSSSSSTSSSSAKRSPPNDFLADQTHGSHYGPSLGCKVDVQEVPTVVLEFSAGLLRLYGVWHCHEAAITLFPFGFDIFYEPHPKASMELHSTIQNSHFHHASEKGLTVLPENPKTR
jgi:hypothetical protein